MKKEFILLTAIITIISLSIFTACGKEEPTNQSETITGLFDNNTSATVKGYLTDTEWVGVPDKIKNALNAMYTTSIGDPIKDAYKTMFTRGIIIIVEKNPSYTNWKTITDGKTIYINLNSVNNSTLQSNITAAIEQAHTYTAMQE